MFDSGAMEHHIVSLKKILRVNLFDLSHVSTFSKSLFMSFMILLYAFPLMKTLVSSANSIENSKSDDLEKSLIYMNKRGSSMDPCVISFLSDLQSLYSTNCSLNDK